MSRKRKTSTEYARERREAMRYADCIMNKTTLPKPGDGRREWLKEWGLIYNGYIAGIRRLADLGEPDER